MLMTGTQKDLILAMRQQGMTYAGIAGELGLSPNTVKSICRRSDVKIQPPEETADGVCKNCGAPLPPNAGGRKRVFCGDPCRYAWWNRKRRVRLYRLRCLGCGRQFISYGNRKRKFCGRECYIRSRYGEGLP